MRKGITPVLAVTLIVLITITASAVSFVWINSIQSDIQESVGSSASEASDLGAESRLNIINSRGDGLTVQNVGTEDTSTVRVLINGELTEYSLGSPLAPGESTFVAYDEALITDTDYTIQVVNTGGVSSTEIISSDQATTDAGFETGICSDEEGSCNFIHFSGTITPISYNYCACCGDDGRNDVFYNSTHMCSFGGVISDEDSLYIEDMLGDHINFASGKGICELKGNTWMESNVTLVNTSTTTVSGSQSIEVGDFDNDGDLDVIMTTYSNGNYLYAPGYGNGSFGTITSYAIGGYTYALAVGDMNNDDNLDFVIVDPINDEYHYVQGDGDGTFQTPSSAYAGEDGDDIALGDMNNDGNLDILIANRNEAMVSYIQGDGDGTFQPKVNLTSQSPFGIAVGDMNNDGNLDIVAVNYNHDTYSYIQGNGDGTFQTTVNTAISDSSHDTEKVVLGDFNNDGNLDIVSANWLDSYSYVQGNGDGTFQAYSEISLLDAPKYINAGDMNNDGNLDLIISTVDNNYHNVILGNGDGTFQTPLQNMNEGNDLAVGDFDNDGDLDVVSSFATNFLYEENTGFNSGSGGPCCETGDTFSNSTNSCTNGVFS